jgi:uncharacterized protein
MPSTVRQLQDKQLISPPTWLADNIHYETIMGSMAYGVSSDTSDCDIYGFAIPPKEMVFPHLAGEIFGFGRQKKRFDQWQQHGNLSDCVVNVDRATLTIREIKELIERRHGSQ